MDNRIQLAEVQKRVAQYIRECYKVKSTEACNISPGPA